MEEFRKDMFESGKHIVEYRNGVRRLYLNGFFIGLYCGMPLITYNDDLTSNTAKNMDIVLKSEHNEKATAGNTSRIGKAFNTACGNSDRPQPASLIPFGRKK